MQKWLFLIVAIMSEVAGTAALKSAEGFTKVWPSTIVVLGYASAFYFLSLTLKSIPVGIAYAIWSGVGTVLIALVAWLFMGQKLDVPAVIGILLIVLGVLVINVFSKSASH
jgi:small multidrug resistance pump